MPISGRIICLDSDSALRRRISRGLSGANGYSRYSLGKVTKLPEDALDLAENGVPVLLVVSEAAAKTLPAGQLHPPEHIRTLVIADSPEASTYADFLHRGCSGVLESNSSDEMLLKAIEAIFAGELWVPRRILSQIVQSLTMKSPPKLTARESEILQLIDLGFKNQEIADRLFISRETVRWHLRGLYAKIGASHRPGALQHVRRPAKKTSADPH